jgi:mono/diheme cytochrome c family protein
MRYWIWIAVVLLVGCAATKPGPVPSGAEPHMGTAWFSLRADTLSITSAQARARDAALPDGSDGQAPTPGTLDAQTAAEANVLWAQNCAACHGIDGVPPTVQEGQAQPRKWTGMGPTMGFFFGADKMRAGIYTTIHDGRGSMAGWGEHLSREQIWALVNHIEGF